MTRLTVDFGQLLDTVYTQPLAMVIVGLAVFYAAMVVTLMYFGRK